MKAYTIKNKDGEYLSRYTNYDYRYSEKDRRNICWTNNETNIRFMSECGAKHTLKELNLEDCEIVEITIEETNHQTQKALECLKEVKEFNAHCVYSNSKIDKFIDNKIKELEEGK